MSPVKIRKYYKRGKKTYAFQAREIKRAIRVRLKFVADMEEKLMIFFFFVNAEHDRSLFKERLYNVVN